MSIEQRIANCTALNRVERLRESESCHCPVMSSIRLLTILLTDYEIPNTRVRERERVIERRETEIERN